MKTMKNFTAAVFLSLFASGAQAQSVDAARGTAVLQTEMAAVAVGAGESFARIDGSFDNIIKTLDSINWQVRFVWLPLLLLIFAGCLALLGKEILLSKFPHSPTEKIMSVTAGFQETVALVKSDIAEVKNIIAGRGGDGGALDRLVFVSFALMSAAVLFFVIGSVICVSLRQ